MVIEYLDNISLEKNRIVGHLRIETVIDGAGEIAIQELKITIPIEIELPEEVRDKRHKAKQEMSEVELHHALSDLHRMLNGTEEEE